MNRAQSVAAHAMRALVAVGVALGGALACERNEDPAPKDPTPDPPPERPRDPSDPLAHGLTPEEAAKVVAKVGDHEITVGELAERILAQSPYLRARYAAPDRRREILNELIDFHLLAEEARRRGLGELPEVERTRKQRMIEEMLSAHLREHRDEVTVSEADITAYYEAHPEEWSQPEQVRASHILVSSEAEAARIIETLAADPGNPATWRRLASTHNRDEATKRTFGDLRFFSRPDEEEGPHVRTPIARAAFALEAAGDIHPQPVRTPEGWHVVRLTDRRAALRRSLDEVRRAIESKLWREKQDAAVDNLVEALGEKFPYEVHPERVPDVRLPNQGGTP